MTGSICVNATQEGDTLEFVPTRNHGPRGKIKGFSELLDQTIMLTIPWDEAMVGAATIRAWDRCL
jgi:hypothetical protein